MMQTVAVHGRQPAIGRAELESLFGADKLQPIGNIASGISMPANEIAFNRLGGTMKLARTMTELPTTDWGVIEKYLAETIPKHLEHVHAGKFKLGLSIYGLPVAVSKINSTALRLKKTIKATGRSVRIIPNKELELNSAQVLRNQLTGSTGWELLIIKNGSKTVLAQTYAVQDIDAYAARDQARPKRDARVGMLPPKLAQIIINLSVDKLTVDSKQLTVLDPFCGTGVVLQEATLMGFNALGTDLDERMVDYSMTNLEWLRQKYVIKNQESRIHQGDATSTQWSEPFDVITAETYLGRPFSAIPDEIVLNEVIQDVDTIHKKFLRNVARQTKPGFRMCLAMPAWKTKTGFKHLPVLDQLTEMGYTRLSFEHALEQDLIYHRENQIVGRELVTLIRK